MTAQTQQAGEVAPFGRLLTNKVAIFAFFGIICASWAYIMANKSDSVDEEVPTVHTVSAASLVPDVSAANVVEGSRLKLRAASPDVEEVELEDAVRLAGRYLVQHGRPNGRFVYLTNPNPEVPVNQSRYNMLRHAGTLYSLVQFCEFEQNSNHALHELIVNAAKYLHWTISPLPSDPNLLAVWSRPEMIGEDDEVVKAKLGGAGLALVALSSANRLEPELTSLDMLQRLGEFVLYMQKPDGSFFCMYKPKIGGRDHDWVSLYYPGEAALGLVLLHEQDPDRKWFNAAVRAIAFLAYERAGREHVEADHWALLATKAILQSPAADDSVPKELLIQHAAQVCESILAEQFDCAEGNPLYGGFSVDGRTCPTATRLEGLIAARSILPAEYDELKLRMDIAIENGIDFLLNSQITSGDLAGGIPRSICRLDPSHEDHSKSFNRRASEIRIDYVQHSLSAFITYLQSQQEDTELTQEHEESSSSETAVNADQQAEVQQFLKSVNSSVREWLQNPAF